MTVSRVALDVRLNSREAPHYPQIDFSFPRAGFSFCSGRGNGDIATDLLVVQNLESPEDRLQRRDWMLINAGRGQQFRALPVPQPPVRNGLNGNGDTCSAIPGYRGDRAAWTISNGRSTPLPEEERHRGYRQLVIWPLGHAVEEPTRSRGAPGHDQAKASGCRWNCHVRSACVTLSPSGR